MSTKSSTRIKLVALAAAITGSLVFVSEVQAQPDPTPVPAVIESLERQTAELNAGEPSVFVPIPSFRALDTRVDWDSKFRSGEGPGVFPGGGFDGEAFGVPLDATAVTFNVTAAQTEGRGHIEILKWEPGDPTHQTSTVNWTESGQNIANSGTVALTEAFWNDGGTESVYFLALVGGRGDAKAHVVVDITGYYIPAG